ncbi:MAG: isopenicillin N synthase family oxygenase [Actinomycetota bacterium]|nr:isopenicillin N synthase family oxygenase [Actinomycetota bacterium]
MNGTPPGTSERSVDEGSTVPTIDIAPLLDPAASEAERDAVAARIGDACERFGFLQIVGHGVDPALRAALHDAAERFFALDDEEKDAVAMRHGGRAWRGWFGHGGELTSGVPDDKEGYYFGTELPADDPAVLAGRPLHGPNLFPERPAELGALVLEWMDRVTAVGQVVLSGIARSLGLAPDWFERWTADPTVLFRIFHYPPPPEGFAGSWGVAEHTDYGLLTLLVQDDTGGLEVRVAGAGADGAGADVDGAGVWIDVPPADDAIVCNLGDMLERVTGGRFRSTPHRVRLPSSDRYSFPLFLDPAWDAEVRPIPGFEPTERALAEAAAGRWDGTGVLDVGGPYGKYLLAKVSKVFPELFRNAL